MENCSVCGAPLAGNECSCAPDKCKVCCDCEPGCECGCKPVGADPVDDAGTLPEDN